MLVTVMGLAIGSGYVVSEWVYCG